MARRVRRKGSRRFTSAVSSPVGVLVSGGLYGASRAYLSNKLSPVLSKIPLGNIADEAGLFMLAWFANKKISNKMVKDVAKAAMVVEAARMGEAVVEGSVFPSSSSSSSTGTTLTY